MTVAHVGLILLCSVTALSAAEAIDIGSRRELFVDHLLIDQLDGARLAMHRPQPRQVSIRFDKPWESFSPGYTTIVHDEEYGLYRMYYRSTLTPPAFGKKRDTPRREVTCYAESKDGIHWTRPSLGLIEFEGSKDNNIVWDGVGSHNLSVMKDANPDCPPDARYKAIGRGKPLANEPSPYEHGLYVLKSPDGIHWKPVRETPVITQGKFDSHNILFWDSVLGAYRAYWRDARKRDRSVPDGRDVRTAISADGVTWENSRMLQYEPGRRGSADTDGKAHQYYTNGIQPYCRAPHMLMGFPMRYIDRGWTASTDQLPALRDRKRASKQLRRLGTALTDTLFMVSRDGVQFHVWPEAFVRPGIQRRGNWFYGDAGIALGFAETRSSFHEGAPNELSFYVKENGRIEEPGQLRRYTLRQDGFASLNASLEGGTALTKPLAFEGDRLEINFSTSAGGLLRVEIQDADGNAKPDFAMSDCNLLYGDQIDRVVSWKAGTNVSQLAGQSVRLKFELKDADLYSFRFIK
ncbi:MAG: hypothetical protein ACYTGL_26370 [Planctomycetota bacterium]|jgi:hypothetical protein